MKINSINISSFGKFSEKTFSFKDGINVIYGANESGKTTLLSFIRYMLFGFNGRRSINNISFEDKYLPWNNSSVSGSLECTFKHNNYMISRVNGARKEVSVINTSTGDKSFEGTVPGESVYRINESGFLRTYYFSGNTCAFGTDKNDSVIKALTSIVETGDELISYSAACSKILSDRKSAFENKSNIESEIISLRKRLERINLLKQNKAELESKLKNIEHNNNISDYNKINNYDKLQQSIEKQSYVKLFHQAKLIILFLLLIVSVIMFVTGNMISGIALSLINAVNILFLLNSCRKLKLLTETINNLSFNIKENTASDDDRMSVYKEIGVIESEIENEFSCDDIFSQLDCLEQNMQKCDYKIKVLDKAKLILDESYLQMKNLFSPVLNKRASEIFSVLTDGKYNDLLITDNFEIKIMHGYDYKSSKKFSVSVYESMYLALRLALCDIFDCDEKLPVFLDDCFISYDDERTKQAVKYLFEYAKSGRQIVFCTCHKRELELFKQYENVNIIEI